MTAYYYDSHGSYFVKGSIGIGGVTAFAGLSTSIPHLHPIFQLLQGNLWEFGWYHVEDTLGFYRDHGVPEVSRVLRSKPQPFKYSSSVDWAKYGGYLTNIAVLSKALQGKPLEIVPGHEHQVLHGSYRGNIGPHLLDDLLQYPDPPYSTTLYGDFGAISLPAFVPPNVNGYQMQSVSAYDNPFGVDFAVVEDRPDYGYVRFLPETLDYLVENVMGNGHSLHLASSFPWCDYNWTFDGLQWHYQNDGDIAITFRSYWEECGGTYYWEWQVTLVIHRELFFTSATTRPPFVGGYWGGLTTATTRLRYEVSALMSDRHPIDPPGFNSMSVGDVYTNVFEPESGFLYSSRAVKGDGGVRPDFDALVRSRKLQDFDQVSVREADIRASAYLSANSALDSISGGIDNNLVEAIGELDEILTLLPEFVKTAKELMRLVQNPEISIFAILDLIASIRLQQKFAIEPSLQLVEQTLPQLEKVAKSFATLSDRGKIVGRGVFEYTFNTGEFGRPLTRLTTHSRVVSSLDTKSVLEKALGARALGLLPSPSAVWALVPFSFVVDWVVGIGSRLRDFESGTFFALSGFEVFTHSFAVNSPLTEDEMAFYGLGVDKLTPGSQPLSMQWYLREISSCVPFARKGRYDFRYPDRLPNWLTAGSLIWQLTFAGR